MYLRIQWSRVTLGLKGPLNIFQWMFLFLLGGLTSSSRSMKSTTHNSPYGRHYGSKNDSDQSSGDLQPHLEGWPPKTLDCTLYSWGLPSIMFIVTSSLKFLLYRKETFSEISLPPENLSSCSKLHPLVYVNWIRSTEKDFIEVLETT